MSSTDHTSHEHRHAPERAPAGAAAPRDPRGRTRRFAGEARLLLALLGLPGLVGFSALAGVGQGGGDHRDHDGHRAGRP